MADISTAVSMARVPILGEDGRISDDYIPAAIGENVTKAEAAATRAETAATDAEGSASAASQSAAQASGSASAASASASQAQQSATTAGGAATSAQSAQTAAEAAKTAAAGSAQDARQSATEAAESAASVADKFIASAQATTLEPGSQATASVADQVLTIGVPKGEKGDTPTVGIGEVTTLAPGEHATATVTETDTGVNINLGIPQGEKGDPGTLENVPVFDHPSGRYTNDSIAAWLSTMRDGRPYGVSVPKGLTVACAKTRSNAGIANPVPGTAAAPGTDPYTTIGPFFHTLVNGGVDADGTPYVTAIEGDGRFSLRPDAGDVFVLAPTLYWLFEDGDGACEVVVSDAPLAGLSPQPKAELPSGALRPYMLYARYGLSFDADGNARSISGGKIANRTVSHDSMITSCKNATTGYSGKSYADDWYVKVMFLLKYATKDSQSVLKGCSQFNFQYHPAVAEAGVKRVILTASQASNVPVGSSWMLGTSATGQTDRNNSECYDVFDACLVTGKDEVDGGNVAVTFDVDATFDTATTYLLSSSPWWIGVCDEVEGDGSPTSNTSGLEPFVLQGIEMSYGLYECLADVILHSDGSTGWQCYLNPDSRDETTGTTEGHIATGVSIPASPDAYGSLYATDVSDAGGLLVGTGSDGSTTTGLCDVTYSNKTSTSGDREFMTLGNLWNWGDAGLWVLYGENWLGSVGWDLGSRLSVNGRSGVSSAIIDASRMVSALEGAKHDR